ncbi:MAG: peptidase M16 [Candidatus Desulfobacillus denitrificans]|uniref:Peptidase M16 n=1 Tax=Candidatus Desulfobacillus denitrificans TaxID=2608985 RepID=A0A809S8H6_9PROT|nr:insulinase family protein [Rhodocyclaceae bacterium]OQY65066.1 MAG: peptidase M16 [Rhodocyclaceae bacterium UTPRO2]BBO19604.1 peptidase M16 [Candidatus Desulfobacillus denitrificans]GIK45718.1 MAG: peptidase M16 [Betaproteobacteria bacterium]
MKKLAFALLLGALATLAQAGPRIEHWTAPSGARVFFIESRVVPIIDVQVDFAAGGAYAPANKAGLAGLTRGLLDTGAGELDEEKIADRLADSGALLGGGADKDRASVSLRTLSSAREREAALALMRLILQQPSFPAAVLDREKARTIAGIREADTRPASIAAKRFAAALYPGHPYGQVPTAESVERISREDLLAFYRAHYGARRAVVSIIGDLSRGEAEALAQELTAGLPDAPEKVSLPDTALPARGTVRIDHPATQAHILLGLPAVRRGDPDYIPLLVGNYILGGGGFVSRLMKEVREKRGYAYSVYSYFQPQRQPGPFEVGLQTKRDQAGAALKVVEEVLAGFLEGGPSGEELKAAQRNLVDGFPLRIDSNRKLLEYLSVIGFYGLPLTYLDDFPRKVQAVTAADIRAAFARHVRPAHFVTVIVGGE